MTRMTKASGSAKIPHQVQIDRLRHRGCSIAYAYFMLNQKLSGIEQKLTSGTNSRTSR